MTASMKKRLDRLEAATERQDVQKADITVRLTNREARELVLYVFVSDGSSLKISLTVRRAIKKIAAAAGGGIIEEDLRKLARGAMLDRKEWHDGIDGFAANAEAEYALYLRDSAQWLPESKSQKSS